jgi:hypothetical protein
VLQSELLGVAHPSSENEHPFSLVARADFSRAEYSPRCSVTICFQIADDCGESKRDVSFDVFEEDSTWSNSSNCSAQKRPEVSWVIGSESLTGGTERLARVPARDDVHQSVKLFRWERFNVRPDRCLIQFSRFHLCDQVRDCEGFDLHISDCSATRENSSESEINASVPGAKAEMIGFGNIHIIHRCRRHTCH